MTKERVYIAGPMTDIAEFNFPLFDAVRDRLIAAGFNVISPPDLTRTYFGDPNHEDPAKRFLVTPEHYPLFMRADLSRVPGCQRILFLPGWAKSHGATAEAFVARMCGLIPGQIRVDTANRLDSGLEPWTWFDATDAFWDAAGVPPKTLRIGNRARPAATPLVATSDAEVQAIKERVAAAMGVAPEDVIVQRGVTDDPLAITRAAEAAKILGTHTIPTHLATGQPEPNRQSARPAEPPNLSAGPITASPTARPAVTSDTVLKVADALVSTTRQGEYGHPADNFAAMSDIWRGITGLDIKPEHVPLMLIGLKMAREANRHHPDNYTDIAGYAKTALMAREKWQGAN